MGCVNCYEKGSVPRTFLSSYFAINAFGTAVDYSTAAVMANDDTDLVELYDNAGITYTPANSRFTVARSGRYLVRMKALVTHDTTDATSAVLVIGVNGTTPATNSFPVIGQPNVLPGNVMYLSDEAYVALNAGEYVVPVLELVGHTTGTPTLLPSKVFVEIIELT